MSDTTTDPKKMLKSIKKISPTKLEDINAKTLNISECEVKHAPQFKIIRKSSPNKPHTSITRSLPLIKESIKITQVTDKKIPEQTYDEIKKKIVIQAILDSPIQDSGSPFEYKEEYVNGRKVTKYDQLLVSLIPRMREVIVEEMMKMDPDKVERILTRIRPEDLDEKAYELAKICLDQVLEDMLAERIEERKKEGIMTHELIEDIELAEAMKVYNKYNKYFYEDEEDLE